MEFYSRIINKHDTEANWNNNSSFIPAQGELIVYDIDNNYNFQRIKMGDGITTVANLPFINIADERFDAIMEELEEIKSLAATGGSLQDITATPGDVLAGKTYNDGEGNVQVGTISSKSAATYGAKTSAQTISAGQYLSGNQTIAAVTQSGLSAANIAKGKIVTVSSNGSNLYNITGSYKPVATYVTKGAGYRNGHNGEYYGSNQAISVSVTGAHDQLFVAAATVNYGNWNITFSIIISFSRKDVSRSGSNIL